MRGNIIKNAAYLFILVITLWLIHAAPARAYDPAGPARGTINVAVFRDVLVSSGEVVANYEKKFFAKLKEMDNVNLSNGPEVLNLHGTEAGRWFNLAAKGSPAPFKVFQGQNVDYLVFFTLKVMTSSALMQVHLVNLGALNIKNYSVIRYFTPSDARTMGGFQSVYLRIRRQFYEHVSAVFPGTLQQKGSLAGREPAVVPAPASPPKPRPASYQPRVVKPKYRPAARLPRRPLAQKPGPPVAQRPGPAPHPPGTGEIILPGGASVPDSGAQVNIPPGGFKSPWGPND